MYTITGSTGHVGAVVAEELLKRGAPVRTVVRERAGGERPARLGAEAATADLGDREAFAEALRGSSGAFVLLPTVVTGGDVEHRALADSIAGAVSDSGVPHVVMLSSIGAELAEGTGPVRWLCHLENLLRGTGTVLSAIRSWHFQEKVETLLPAVLGAGVYPVFGDTVDVPTRMIATADIGRAAAGALLEPPTRSEVVDLEGPQYTEREVAEALESILGRRLEIVTIPRSGWVDSLVEAGLPRVFAQELTGLHDAEQQGILKFRGDRRHACTTGLEETLRRVLA
ncbi:NmrA family NAD(P)-binding protein [Streptomyces sp. P38-E01]|uniref:NmrA family NAD(P)-binding protein n=1 Tax=Streptomyces tardus TaxID=2780544 RepID=A0A949JEC3_9ACTN|nr:NmrA family NAD(P)-binding protein [Streptomyces tardus]MBU7596924.1 NmrA family NAD(P)-binding protein [Streptomyces tardus]